MRHCCIEIHRGVTGNRLVCFGRRSRGGVVQPSNGNKADRLDRPRQEESHNVWRIGDVPHDARVGREGPQRPALGV